MTATAIQSRPTIAGEALAATGIAKEVGAETGGAFLAAIVQAFRRRIEAALTVKYEPRVPRAGTGGFAGTMRAYLSPGRVVIRGCRGLDFIPTEILGQIWSVHFRARLHSYDRRTGECDFQVQAWPWPVREGVA